MSVSQGISSTATGVSRTKAEVSSTEDFAIVNRFGVTVATADSEDLAIATGRRLRLQFSGLTVQRIETTVRRETIYRPRSPQ